MALYLKSRRSGADLRNHPSIPKTNVAIYGGVCVAGVEYEDGAIHNLLSKDLTGWRYLGDASEAENCILIVRGDGERTFSGRKALPRAIEYLRKIGA